MVPGLLIAFGILTIWNMIEHAVGSYFLFRRRKEFLLLFLFSIVNFLYAAINFGFFVIKMTNTSVKVYVIYATLFRIPFYWMMMMLTLERFLVVFLHLRYGKFDFFSLAWCLVHFKWSNFLWKEIFFKKSLSDKINIYKLPYLRSFRRN